MSMRRKLRKQLECIPGQINKTVNEMYERKSNSTSTLKVASQEKRQQKWKEHFKNLLKNPP